MTGTPIVVAASAGTGKTHTLVGEVVRRVADGVPIERIAVVTFTEAATAELRDRVRRRLAQALTAGPDATVARRLRTALADFDRAAISTIHGFCHLLRRDLVLASGARPDAAIQADDAVALRRLAVDAHLAALDVLPPGLGAPAAIAVDRLERVARLAQDPDLDVEPGSRSDPRRPPDPAPWLLRVDALAAVWDPGGVAAAIAAADVFKARRGDRPGLPPKQVATAIEDVTRWLGSPDPTKLPGDLLRAPNVVAATREGPPPAHPAFAALDAVHHTADGLADAIGDWALAVQHDVADRARGALAADRRRRNVRTYDELIRDVRDALSGPLAAAARRRFDAALVDEFQDTDPVQWEIFRALFPHDLWIVGDPKQAIYGFRGADVGAWDRAVAEGLPKALHENWRSDGRLVAALHHLFGRDEVVAPLGSKLTVPSVSATQPDQRLEGTAGPALEVVFFPCDGRVPEGKTVGKGVAADEIAATVVHDVAAALAAGWQVEGRRIGAADCAVVVRTNHEAHDIRDRLVRRGIPAIARVDDEVFAAPVAGSVEAVLRAMVEPTAAHVKLAFTAPILGRTGDELVDLLADVDRMSAELTFYRDLGRMWRDGSVATALRAWLDRGDVAERLLSGLHGERALTDVLHLLDLLHAAARQHRLGPEGLLAWFAARRRLGGGDEAHARRLESDADAVQVVTVHAAKGLEYGLVWCASLWRGGGSQDRPPLVARESDTGRRVLDLGGPDAERRVAERDRAAIEEEHRVMYVALTRAKHRCVVYWVATSDDPPLAGLLHARAERPAEERRASAMQRRKDDALVRMDLARLAAGCPAFGWREVPAGAPETPLPAPAPTDVALAIRTLQRSNAPDASWHRTSFTALARGGDGPHREVDDPDGGAAPVAPEGPIPLAGFPGGARVGTAVHAVFERMDFQTSEPPVALAVEELARAGVDAGRWAGPLAAAIQVATRCPLGEGDRLADLDGTDRIDEMFFTLPLRGGLSRAGDRFDPAALAAAFDGPDSPGPLAGLGFLPVRGYLVGAIDLIARTRGRTWIVDYKTNWLGDDRSDYRPDALDAAMQRERYTLQAGLYALAVHRFLRVRQRAYDPTQHLGPVRYLFVRGADDAGRGVWSWQPTASFLDRLDAAVEGP